MTTDSAPPGSPLSASSALDLAHKEAAHRDDPSAHNAAAFGAALLKCGQGVRARSVLMAAVDATEGADDGLCLLLARAQLETGRPSHSKRLLARLLSRAPENLGALLLLAEVLIAEGQPEDAWVVMTRAQQSAPDDPRVLRLVALANEGASVKSGAAPTRPGPIQVLERDGQMRSLADGPLRLDRITGHARPELRPAPFREISEPVLVASSAHTQIAAVEPDPIAATEQLQSPTDDEADVISSAPRIRDVDALWLSRKDALPPPLVGSAELGRVEDEESNSSLDLPAFEWEHSEESLSPALAPPQLPTPTPTPDSRAELPEQPEQQRGHTRHDRNATRKYVSERSQGPSTAEPSKRSDPPEPPSLLEIPLDPLDFETTPKPATAGFGHYAEPAPKHGAPPAHVERSRQPAVRQPTARQPAVRRPAPTTPMRPVDPGVVVLPRQRRWGRVVVLIGLTLVAALIATSSWRYRVAARAAQAELETIRLSLLDGNFSSRLTASARLSDPPKNGSLFTRLGAVVANATGNDDLDQAHGERAALSARVEAERVAIYGDTAQLSRAQQLSEQASRLWPGQPDSVIAAALLRLSGGAPEASAALLSAWPKGDEPGISRARARVALAAGDLEAASQFALSAQQHDASDVNARYLGIEVLARRGGRSRALEAWEALAPAHVDSMIALNALRIEVGKRSEAAVASLRQLLEGSETLGPRQRGAIHAAIGRHHLLADRLPEALESCRAAMAADPQSHRHQTNLARAQIKINDLDGAESTLRAALKHHPKAPDLLMDLARLALRRGASDAALTALSLIVAPTADTLYVQAQALLDAGRIEGARAALERASRAAPHSADMQILLHLSRLLLRPKSQSERRALDDLRTPAPPLVLTDTALPYRAMGLALSQAGSSAAAVLEFERALALDPTDFRSHLELCRLAAARRDAAGAMAHCRAGHALNPAHRPTASRLAALAEALGDPGGVIDALGVKGERPSTTTTADRRRLGRAFATTGNGAALSRLAESATDQPTRLYLQGLGSVDGEQVNLASQRLYAAAQALPKDGPVLLSLGTMLLNSGQSERAAEAFANAMRQTDTPDAALGAAQAALRLGKMAGARKFAIEAARRTRRTICRPESLAEAYSLQGMTWLGGGPRGLVRARQLFTKALKANPKDPTASVGLGRLAQAKGDVEGAARHLRRALESDPSSAEARFRLGALLVSRPESVTEGRSTLKDVVRLAPDSRWGALAKRRLEAKAP